MNRRVFEQDPGALLDYVVTWVLEAPDTISASTWEVVPAGLTLSSEVHDAATATVWLTGGSDGADYLVTNRVTTAGGREAEQTFRVNVRAKIAI